MKAVFAGAVLVTMVAGCAVSDNAGSWDAIQQQMAFQKQQELDQKNREMDAKKDEF